ncbi:MAG: MBL fold metallo-hydrolase [Proteobacteria bacterium]|nr:MBL fold metallo-hydrolase [Pseudomonadota bacterium]
MKIKYIGHACFLVLTADGMRILTDPYEPDCYDGALKYRPIREEADVVLVSHSHPDHSGAAYVPGKPVVIDRPGPSSVGSVEISGIQVWHDASGGAERGENIIFRIAADDLVVCHLGDVGHGLDSGTARKLRPVDVLLIPVGGYFTADQKAVDDIISDLDPALVIPMHYKTSGCDFPIAPVEDFLKGRGDVSRPGSSEISLKAGDVPGGTLVLEPANLP